jgi:hypothetical protein
VLYQAELHPEPRAIIHSRYAVGEKWRYELAIFIVTRYDNSHEQSSYEAGQAQNGESDVRR